MSVLHTLPAADVAREIAALAEQLGEQTGNSDTRQDHAVFDRWTALRDALAFCRAETQADALALLAHILERAADLEAGTHTEWESNLRIHSIERAALAVARIIEAGTPERLADFGEFGYLTRTTGDATASPG